MARAQTIQSAGETPAGGNSSLPCHNTCRVELPCPLHTWPGMLNSTTNTPSSSGTSTGAIHIHHYHHHHHHLQPIQALYVSYPLSYSHPDDNDDPRVHQQLPAASPPNRRDLRCRGAPAPGDVSGERSGNIEYLQFCTQWVVAWCNIKTTWGSSICFDRQAEKKVNVTPSPSAVLIINPFSHSQSDSNRVNVEHSMFVWSHVGHILSGI